MDIDKAKQAVDELGNIQDARNLWEERARDIIDRFTGIRGVSGNVCFVDDALALFDQHVDHLIASRRREIDIALNVE